MIFRKHLCGGFGILISQNAEVEKILHFSVVSKMVGLLQHGSILPGLNPQVTPKDSQSSFDVPNTKIPPRYTKNLPQTPQDIPKQHQAPPYLQSFKVVIWWSVYEELNEGGAIVPY